MRAEETHAARVSREKEEEEEEPRTDLT